MCFSSSTSQAMDCKSVCEIAAKYEKMALVEEESPTKLTTPEESIYSKYCNSMITSNQPNDDLGIEDELTENDFIVPRIDELTSSDESDHNDDHYYVDNDKNQMLNSIASSVRSQFLKNLPTKRKNFNVQNCQFGTSAFQILTSHTPSSTRQVDKSSLTLPVKPRVSQQSNSDCLAKARRNSNLGLCIKSPIYETIQEAADFVDISLQNDVVIKQNPGASAGITCQSKPISIDSSALSFMRSTDLPRNALVLYLGYVKMNASELRELDLSRPLESLILSTKRSFALLRILEKSFILEDCDEVSSCSKLANENKLQIETQKPLVANQEKKSAKKTLLSCIGFSNSPKYQSIQHRDSLHLKSYENLRKRRKSLEFLYQQVIFNGTEINGMPENMLTWIYHVVKEENNSVQCYLIECDDSQHAKLLTRALSNQIAASNCR